MTQNADLDDDYLGETTFDRNLDTLLNLRHSLDAGIEAMLENKKLREEAHYWRNKYQESLNDSIKHSEAMMSNMLTVLLDKENNGKE